MIHVVLDPAVGAALARHAEGLNRAALDAKLPNPFQGEFLTLFNDPAYSPAHPMPLFSACRGIDPSKFATGRLGNVLSEKYKSLRLHFTSAWDNWSCSGQGDATPEKFWMFCNGMKMVMYAWFVWKDSPSLDIVLKTIPTGEFAF